MTQDAPSTSQDTCVVIDTATVQSSPKPLQSVDHEPLGNRFESQSGTAPVTHFFFQTQ